jgi:hypothetical protein
MNIIFHIGFHKTGTTTIQNCLTKAHEELLEQKIFYPLGLGSYRTQHGAIPDLLKLDLVEQAISLIREIKEEASQKNCSTVIISAEEFENLALNHNLEKFFLNLSTLFEKVYICCAARNIFDLVKSKIRQRLIHFGFDFYNSQLSTVNLVSEVIEKQSYIANRFKAQLNMVNFDIFKLVHNKNIVHFVFEDILPEISKVNFEQINLNQFRAFSCEELLMPLVRSIYAKDIKKNPYSTEVDDLVKSFSLGISGPTLIFLNDINQRLTRELEGIVIEANIDFDKYFIQFNTPKYLQNILAPEVYS